MEALAARQLSQQHARLAMKVSPIPVAAEPTPEERRELNKLLGFADCPSQVFALGKDECAAVWWPEVDDETISAWEVHRYRKDRSRPNEDIWQYKGFISFPDMIKTQTIINQLSNDYEYRFTVKSVNSKGAGTESSPSNPVMVEKPLPTGWYRFLDKRSKRHYYANLRLNASSWTRPELDPWFLDEALLMSFEAREITTLKCLYKEDIAHFKCISVDQFMDVLREIGEHCSKSWVTQLFRGYAGSDKQLQSWKHFMEVINHIKRYRMGAFAIVQNPLEKLMSCLRRQRVGVLLQPKAEKMGDWVVDYSTLAERSFYRNARTGETYWSMPPQVKFYIPPRLEDKLLLVFDYGDLEEFQQYFSLLDIDNSGDLSGKEIRILLRALDIKLPERKFTKLLKTVDLNGNGTIEFDEYCWMMLQIFRKDNTGFWRDVRSKSRAIAAAQPPMTILEEEVEDNSQCTNTAGALGLSEGSMENSLFGDKAWGSKLSYTRMRTVLNNMKQFAASSGRKGRFSLTANGSFRSGVSFLSGSMKQNSLNNLNEDSSIDGSSSGVWCCMCIPRRRGRNHSSRLNSVLSKYDENQHELEQQQQEGHFGLTPLSSPTKPGGVPYYPPASIKSSPCRPSQVGAEIPSAPIESPISPATSRPSRRVSFTQAGFDTKVISEASSPEKIQTKGILRDRLNSVGSGVSALGESPVSSPGISPTKKKTLAPGAGATGPADSVGSLGRSTSRKSVASKASSSRRSSRQQRQDQADASEEDLEADNRSVVSYTSAASLMRRLWLGGGDEDSSGSKAKAHPKHCMCGCRAY